MVKSLDSEIGLCECTNKLFSYELA